MNATELESLCAAWPGVASSVKWEDDLVFTVAGKMFAVYCLRGPHRERVSFKVDPERFLELTDQPGITPAAYMARAFWITIAEPDRFARAKIAEFVRHAYDLVRAGLSKKQQAALAEKDVAATTPAKAAKPAAPKATKAAPAKAAKRATTKPAKAAKSATMAKTRKR
jgi:predicted DNA-binding protein (MmcQ/YjbR family)